MLLPRNIHGCPYLLLAPMEGVGDRCFRKALATIGGFDEAVRDFLRVPRNAHVESLAKEYIADELLPIPLAAQLMGSDPELMAAMAQEMEKRGATRVDFNCGCPSKIVTGRGAGSSLLQDPRFLQEVASHMVKAVSIPVTIKMRSGFEDISLFEENLLAAQESGVAYITLHPRTKVDGYGPPARWDLIARAKQILRIPLVGNGDILTPQDAVRMLKETGCDALMIGRGAVANPFIFNEIKAHFQGGSYEREDDALSTYFATYLAHIPPGTTPRTAVNKLKQILNFMFKANAPEKRLEMLTTQSANPEEFLNLSLSLLFDSAKS